MFGAYTLRLLALVAALSFVDCENVFEKYYGQTLDSSPNPDTFEKVCILERLVYVELFKMNDYESARKWINHLSEIVEERTKLGQSPTERQCPSQEFGPMHQGTNLNVALQEVCNQATRYRILDDRAGKVYLDNEKMTVRRYLHVKKVRTEAALNKFQDLMESMLAIPTWFPKEFISYPASCSMEGSLVTTTLVIHDSEKILEQKTDREAELELAQLINGKDDLEYKVGRQFDRGLAQVRSSLEEALNKKAEVNKPVKRERKFGDKILACFGIGCDRK